MLPDERKKFIVWSMLGFAVRFWRRLLTVSNCFLYLFLLFGFSKFSFSSASALLIPVGCCCAVNSVSQAFGFVHSELCCVFSCPCCSGFKSRHAIAKFHVCYWWINEITFQKPVENICSWIGKFRILTHWTKLWQLKVCGNRCHAVMSWAMHRQHYPVCLLAM